MRRLLVAVARFNLMAILMFWLVVCLMWAHGWTP